MTTGQMAILISKAHVTLYPRSGYFVAFVTITHRRGMSDEWTYSTLWTQRDMDTLAGTGTMMPDWYNKPAIDLERYFDMATPDRVADDMLQGITG